MKNWKVIVACFVAFLAMFIGISIQFMMIAKTGTFYDGTVVGPITSAFTILVTLCMSLMIGGLTWELLDFAQREVILLARKIIQATGGLPVKKGC